MKTDFKWLVIMICLAFLVWQFWGGSSSTTTDKPTQAQQQQGRRDHAHSLVQLTRNLCRQQIKSEWAHPEDIAYYIDPEDYVARGDAKHNNAYVELHFVTPEHGQTRYRARCRYVRDKGLKLAIDRQEEQAS